MQRLKQIATIHRGAALAFGIVLCTAAIAQTRADPTAPAKGPSCANGAAAVMSQGKWNCPSPGAQPGQPGDKAVESGESQVLIGLLLPAVQKVRTCPGGGQPVVVAGKDTCPAGPGTPPQAVPGNQKTR